MLRSTNLAGRLLASKRCPRVSASARISRRTITGVNQSNSAPVNPYQAQKSGSAMPSAMEMVHSIPPIVVDGRTASCDGGSGPLGHPRVFINTDAATLDRPQPCPYCGLRFVSKTQVIDEVKGGKKVKQGVDFIMPAEVDSYVNGEKTSH